MTTGTATAGPAQCSPADYRVLAEQIREAGLLDRRPGHYALRIAVTVAVLAGGWAAFFVVGDSWATLGVAAALAVIFTQVVFIGHDAGHLQIANSHRMNRLVGLTVANALSGVSFGWWVPKHNAHHAHPNQLDRDPDIGAGVVAFTFSADVACDRRGFAAFLTRWQAWLFVPLLLIEGAGLHVTSVDALIRRRDRRAATELLLIAGHAALYLTAVFWVLSPVRALAFMAVQQGLFGLYLGCSFAPNHKGMPILDRDVDMSFVTRQVITARNVRGGWFIAFLFGGLNYQIEHHLFPTMPRPNLVRAQSFVWAFCVEHDLPYCEDSLVGSYRRALHHLSAIGRGQDLRDPAWQ